ncbi:MAG: patatin-like phospholipase family protein, partial [Sedimenticolaceae bacterium]
MSTSDGKTISLVLGSGGARGLAHIGVIRALERHGWKIGAIAGSSIGA